MACASVGSRGGAKVVNARAVCVPNSYQDFTELTPVLGCMYGSFIQTAHGAGIDRITLQTRQKFQGGCLLLNKEDKRHLFRTTYILFKSTQLIFIVSFRGIINNNIVIGLQADNFS